MSSPDPKDAASPALPKEADLNAERVVAQPAGPAVALEPLLDSTSELKIQGSTDGEDSRGSNAGGKNSGGKTGGGHNTALEQRLNSTSELKIQGSTDGEDSRGSNVGGKHTPGGKSGGGSKE